MLHRSATTILVLLSLGVGAYDVRLSGAVYDKSGKGVLGARVRLARSGLSTATGPDGKWVLSAGISLSLPPASDTILVSGEDERIVIDGKAISSLERTDIVFIVDPASLVSLPTMAGSSITASVRSPRPSISAEPPPKGDKPATAAVPPTVEASKETSPPPPPPKPRDPLSDRDLLAWDRPLPPKTFAVQAGFTHETWTGSYEDAAILYGEPSSQAYDFDARVGLWELREGAWTEAEVSGAVFVRNDDAGDQQGLSSPRLALNVGMAKWAGASVEMISGLGGTEIVGDDPPWSFGFGAYASPTFGFFHMTASTTYHPSLHFLSARMEPQVFLGKRVSLYAGTRFWGVFDEPDRACYASGYNAVPTTERRWGWLVMIDPGTRVQLGRIFGFDLAIPLTIAGRSTAAEWAIRTSVRAAFGL